MLYDNRFYIKRSCCFSLRGGHPLAAFRVVKLLRARVSREYIFKNFHDCSGALAMQQIRSVSNPTGGGTRIPPVRPAGARKNDTSCGLRIAQRVSKYKSCDGGDGIWGVVE
jgi:hypothetical protein